MEDSSNPKTTSKKLLERLRGSSFPPAAVAGAFASFAGAALGSQSGPAAAQDSPALVQINLAQGPSTPVRARFALEYAHSFTLGASTFRRSLAGIAIGDNDTIYVLGDGEVRIYEPGGRSVRKWKAPDRASCIAVGGGERVYLGGAGRVEAFDRAGERKGGFEAGGSERLASVTAIKTFGNEILVADAAARCIRRYDPDGKPHGEIGTRNKAGGFMLPNRFLDFDIDSEGVVAAADSGRHQVTSWTLAGAPAGRFGKFGMMNPEDFVGCCNPVNLAFAPDGRIVTAEKVIARVKIYDAAGKLLALIGPEHFDPKCTHLHLAVDSKGRILVADPARLAIKVFSAMVKAGQRESI